MTLVDFYYIAEIIAATAVIASLIYVGIQIKQNTQATQIAAAQSFAEIDNGFVGLINASNELPDVLHRGAQGLSELQGGDLIRFMAFHDQVLIAMQAAFQQWRTKTLDERLWGTFRHAFVDLLSQPGQREWWQIRRHWFDDDFQEYVDRSVESIHAKPMHPGAVED
jgi:hypothetical protein